MEYSNVCSEKGRGSEISSAVSVLASERRQAVAFKAKRPAPLSEKSSDSSPISGVSTGSKMRSPNGPAVSSKDAQLGSDSAMPSGKRHCSFGAKDALKKPSPDNAKRGNLIRVESEITTEGIQGAVVDPGCPDITADGMNPADLVSWPDNAVLDFSMDHVDSGEIEDINGASVKSSKKLPVAAVDQKEGKQASDKEASQDSQSESAAVAGDGAEDQQGAEGTSASSGKGKPAPPGKRKVKVDWTPELHRRFVQAVEQLGVEKAIPSRILELMGVKCLTRHNIASHLQKYRSHRRHLAAREAEAANWQQQRKAADAPLWPVAKPGAPFSWNPYPGSAAPGAPAAAGFVPGTPAAAAAGPVPGRPVMGMPPSMGGMVQGLPTMGPPPVAVGQPQPAMGTPHGVQAIGMPMHVWGHPAMDPAQAHMWQRPGNAFQMAPSAWYGPDGSVWQYPTPYAASPAVDMWGQPAAGMPPGGMVAGTPCFPPHMMPHMGSQHLPGGMTCGAPVHGVPSPAPGAPVAGAPMTPMESKKQNYHQQQQQQQHQQNSTTVAPAPEASAFDEANVIAGGCENDLTMDGLGLDSFLDEAVTESMFAVPDELSLNFNCTPEDISELQASNILDAAISEALANPSTPLPIGLKPPSVDGVLEELNRQGITMLPPVKAAPTMAAANTVSSHEDFSPISAVENIGDDALGQADMLAYDDTDEDALSQEALNALLDP